MAAPAKKPAAKPAAKPKGGGSKSSGPGFLMKHGERVGLAVAGVLALLLIAMSLFMPESGFAAGSPDDKAKELKTKTDMVSRRLNDSSNVPGEADLPPKDSSKKRLELDKTVVSAGKYATDPFTDSAPPGTPGRRPPSIYPVEEALAAIGRVQIKTYLLTKKDGKDALVMLKGGSTDNRDLAGKMGGPGGGRGGPGGGSLGPPPGASGLGMPGAPAQAEDESKKDKKVEVVTLDKLASATGMSPAMQIRPLRLAVIGASFPYKKQVDEFRAKLGLRSVAEVISEASAEIDEKTKKPIPNLAAFRFLGVIVERREVDGDGKPGTPWTELKLGQSYREYIRHAGREFESDDAEFAKVSFTGLVMPKLKQFRPEEHGLSAASAGGMPGMPLPPMGGGGRGGGSLGPPPASDRLPPGAGGTESGEPVVAAAKTTASQYPAVEKQLSMLAAALKKLEGKKSEEVAAPSRFNGDDFNPFGPTTPPAPGGGRGGEDPPRSSETPSAAGVELPEHCLVRVIDVTVEPGKTYEYRLKVRMANPNKDRRDVANPMYAEPDYLDSPWASVPYNVAVTPELMYFAVDQKEVDEAADRKKRYEGPYAKLPINRERMVVLQGHRWLTDLKLDSGARLIIGEWAVAERMPVYRGEYVGRDERIEMPVWRHTREAYVMADDGGSRRGPKTLRVPFRFEAKGGMPDAMVVDFHQGRRGYERVTARAEEKVETKKVEDSAATQVLLMNPDGKLVLREAAFDTSDKERAARLKDFRKRIEDVKKGSEKAGTGSGGFTPR